jgi:sulfur carrier protein
VIQIQLNGEALLLASCTIHELLASCGWQGKRIAVECNGMIVPKSRHAETRLAAGDRLEIVVAVGGG